jgi:hypothetical protein
MSVRTVRLLVNCVQLPDPNWGGHSEIWLGVQRGKTVEQAIRLPQEAIELIFELQVDGDQVRGPYAQGTPQDRFLYGNWGRWIGNAWSGFRRIKIPIRLLIDALQSKTEVRATLVCTNSDGSPIAATIKPEFLTIDS